MAEHWVASRLFGCNKYLHSIVSHHNAKAHLPLWSASGIAVR